VCQQPTGVVNLLQNVIWWYVLEDLKLGLPHPVLQPVILDHQLGQAFLVYEQKKRVTSLHLLLRLQNDPIVHLDLWVHHPQRSDNLFIVGLSVW